MQQIKFYKYQGTGNDFVVIDNRESSFPKDNKTITELCSRKFGIGSDGLILIENHSEYDFEMVFYNPDASQSFCGNGSRCAVAFARFLKIIDSECTFLAIDGVHKATIEKDWVSIKMGDITSVEKIEKDYFVNTGSPHYVHFDTDIKAMDMVEYGKSIRYSERYSKEGTNVNVVEKKSENNIFIRTYERGVENETLSCGTGVTACALTFGMLEGISKVSINTLGGDLKVSFNQTKNGFDTIWLEGPAIFVFEGNVII